MRPPPEDEIPRRIPESAPKDARPPSNSNLAASPLQRAFGIQAGDSSPAGVRTVFIPPETVARVVADLVPGEEGERIMTTLAERWKREGMERGMEKGKAEGKAEALRAALEDGLQAKFGNAGLSLAPALREIADADRLRDLLRDLWTVPDFAAFAERVAGE